MEAVSADAIPMEIYQADATTLVASGDNLATTPVVPGATYLVKVGPGAAAASCGTAYDYRITATP